MTVVYPIDHPLRSAYLKTHRASTHINALKRSIARGFNPEYTVVEKPITKGPLNGLAKVVEITIEPSLKAEQWGLIVGDIVTNLRDSFDHIAWALALKHVSETGRPKLSDQEGRAVQFPLYDAPDAWSDAGRGGRAMQNVLASAHATIESFQPYNRTKWPELRLLGDLNQLANVDKHRLVTYPNVRSPIQLVPGEQVTAILNQEGQYQFMADINHHLEPAVAFEIAVYPRDALHPMSIDELSTIYDFVAGKVLPAFASFF